MRIRGCLLAAIAFPICARPLIGQERAVSVSEAEARAVARGFGDALARGDSVGALAMLTDDVVILEGDHAESKQEYRSGHVRADIAYASAVKAETLSDAVTITGEVALYTRQSRTSGRYRNRDIDRTSTEAMVLMHTAEGWRIRQIHWP